MVYKMLKTKIKKSKGREASVPFLPCSLACERGTYNSALALLEGLLRSSNKTCKHSESAIANVIHGHVGVDVAVEEDNYQRR